MHSRIPRRRVWLAAALLPLASPADRLFDPADVEAGKGLYSKCLGCHSPERNRTGPLHCGLFGRVSGTVAGFEYSEAMRQAEITWNARTLDRFLEAPLETVPGTSMGFVGIPDVGQRRQLIVWLETLTSSSGACDTSARAESTE